MKYRYGFYCSGGASRVIKFYQSNSTNEYPAEFILYDGGRAEIIDSIKDLGLNIFLANQGLGLSPGKQVSEDLLALCDKYKTDYIFCFGDKILDGELLDRYENRIINFHPSLLPAFPGLLAIDQALESSVQIMGNTAHFIDKGVDTGPIILQTAISRSYYSDYEDLLSLQLPMLKKIWGWIEGECLTVVKQKVCINSETPLRILFSHE